MNETKKVFMVRGEYARKAVDDTLQLFGLSLESVQLHVRTKNISDFRRLAILAMRQHTCLSLHDVGEIFERDHTTIKYNQDKAKQLIEIEVFYKRTYERFTQLLIERLESEKIKQWNSTITP